MVGSFAKLRIVHRWLCYLVYLGMKPTNSRAADFFGVWDVRLELRDGGTRRTNGLTFTLLESGVVEVSRGSERCEIQNGEEVSQFGFSFSRRGNQITLRKVHQRRAQREVRRMRTRDLRSLLAGDSDE